ncbi:MAG: hypothetical protein ACI3Y8_02435, partial [Candidatus Cryptobacteroides sp.]
TFRRLCREVVQLDFIEAISDGFQVFIRVDDLIQAVSHHADPFHFFTEQIRHDPEQVNFHPEPFNCDSDQFCHPEPYRDRTFLGGHLPFNRKYNPFNRKYNPFISNGFPSCCQPSFRFHTGKRRFQLHRYQNLREFHGFIIKAYFFRHRYQSCTANQQRRFLSCEVTADSAEDCHQEYRRQQCHQGRRTFHGDKRNAHETFFRPVFAAAGRQGRHVGRLQD